MAVRNFLRVHDARGCLHFINPAAIATVIFDNPTGERLIAEIALLAPVRFTSTGWSAEQASEPGVIRIEGEAASNFRARLYRAAGLNPDGTQAVVL